MGSRWESQTTKESESLMELPWILFWGAMQVKWAHPHLNTCLLGLAPHTLPLTLYTAAELQEV
jgi:hypothetical protein